MDSATCPLCPSKAGVRLQWVTFADGSRHIRQTCKKCGRFLCWAAKTAAAIAAAEPEAPKEKGLFD